MVNNENKEKLVYEVDDLPGLLGISLSTAYQALAKNEIPHIRIGTRILIPKKMLDDFLTQKVPFTTNA